MSIELESKTQKELGRSRVVAFGSMGMLAHGPPLGFGGFLAAWAFYSQCQ